MSWPEEEDTKVVSHLTKLHLYNFVPVVLERAVPESTSSSNADNILRKMFNAVLEAKNDKSRRTMQGVISGLLRRQNSDNSSYRIHASKDMLNQIWDGYLTVLFLRLFGTCGESTHVGTTDSDCLMSEIESKVDNLSWLLDIVIDRRMAREFVQQWADCKKISLMHSKIPSRYKHQISRITAQFCAAIGRSDIVVRTETLYASLSNWFEALCQDFRSTTHRSVDKIQVEEGLNYMISNLPLPQQREILLKWADMNRIKEKEWLNLQTAHNSWWGRVSQSLLEVCISNINDTS